MELTAEIVDEIFNQCYLPFEEMVKMSPTYTEETAPDVAPLLIPLPDGTNACAFRSEKLKQNVGIINELLDQIDWIEDDFLLPFIGLMTRTDGTLWTNNIYEMQKLYALGVASDLLDGKRTIMGGLVKRISRSEAKVTLVELDDSGKVRKVRK